MIDDEKIKRIRKQTQEGFKNNPMHIEDEPQYSGDPKNTIDKDFNEKGSRDEKSSK